MNIFFLSKGALDLYYNRRMGKKERCRFCKIEKLYHFTSLDTALLIIKSLKLKFSSLSNTNDICENSKNIYNYFYGDNYISIDEIRDEIYKYRQISFSIDKEPDGRVGFDLHQMWGLYANKGYGVCLVFDKEKLLNSSKNNYGKVIYSKDNSPDTFTNVTKTPEIRGWIRKNKKRLFFNKRKEWEHEQEFRIIKRFQNDNKEEYLDISKSLRYIIIANAKSIKHDESLISSCEYCKLSKAIEGKDIKILFYESFLGETKLLYNKEYDIWNNSEGYNINKNLTLDID